MKRSLLLIGFFIITICARAQYNSGNLIVSFNTGTTSSGAYRNLSLQEYTTGTTGTANSATAVGSALSTGRMVDDRKAAFEGQINTSADGKYIVLAGRNTTDGTATAAARLAPLSLVRVSKTKTIEYSDFLASDLAFNSGSARSVASLNGNNFFVATAAASADAGIRLATFGNAANTQYSAEASRSVGIWNNEVVAAGATDPSTYISGVASAPGIAPTSTPFSGSPTPPTNNNNYIGLVLFDVDSTEPGNDLMYVAQRNSGIQKYSKSAGAWVYVGNVAPADAYIGGATGFQGMTGRIENGKPVLYAIKIDNASAPNGFKSNLYQIIDNKLRTEDWSVTSTLTIIATSDLATAQTFRGVTFAPTATLSTASFEKTAQSWTMYPNPSKGTLNINSEISGSFSVYNVLGQKVHQFKVENGANAVNVDKLNSGTYFVEGANTSQKLIIQK